MDTIEHSKILVVEGNDDEYLFRALLSHIRLYGVQIVNARGKDNIRRSIAVIRQSPDFGAVSSLGVVRDADTNAASAFQSVRDALVSVGLSAPTEPLTPAAGDPTTVALILPYGENSGTIEDVCLASVADDEAMPCVDEYMRCISEQSTQQSSSPSKAKAQAFLSSRARPGLLLGQAANRGYWNFDHSAFNPLKDLLRML